MKVESQLGAGELRIAKLAEVADYRACQQIQREAWGLREDGYVVPVATMAAVNKYGGLVLGAWRAGQLVGFSFAFLGKLEGETVLYSQLTAVLPQEQGGGTGFALKQGQQEWARGQGLPKIVWAFDPLQSGNANFNLHRLGAYCRHYEPNMYGERSDNLNAGLNATDRLIAEWDVSGSVKAEVSLEESPPVLTTAYDEKSGVREALEFTPPPKTARSVSLEIPASVRALVQHNPDAAIRWQGLVRQAFQALFALNYVAVDFYRSEDGQERRNWYLLKKWD